jgi:hypothetical protein
MTEGFKKSTITYVAAELGFSSEFLGKYATLPLVIPTGEVKGERAHPR